MRKQLITRGGQLVLNVPSGVAVTALPARRFIRPATLFSGRTQQIVGRERNQAACHRQLVRDVVDRRRVNSTVRRLIGQKDFTV